MESSCGTYNEDGSLACVLLVEANVLNMRGNGKKECSQKREQN